MIRVALRTEFDWTPNDEENTSSIRRSATRPRASMSPGPSEAPIRTSLPPACSRSDARVSRLIFGGTTDWDKGDHLSKAAEAAEIDFASMREAIVGEGQMEEIEANQKRLEASGHWGVPTFVFEGEPFFGQDRIDVLRWRLDKKGVPRTEIRGAGRRMLRRPPAGPLKGD